MKYLLPIVVLLSGCASGDDYWQRPRETARPRYIEILYVEDPVPLCRNAFATAGCAIRLGADRWLIAIKSDLPWRNFVCIAHHEFHHTLGFVHSRDWTGDCGNGQRR